MNCATCSKSLDSEHAGLNEPCFCGECYRDIDNTKIELAQEVINLKKEVKRLKKLSMKRGIPIEPPAYKKFKL
jgi:hypothetical protein